MTSADTDRQQLLRFCGLTYGASWLFWIPVALFHPPRGLGAGLIALGGFAPSAAAFWLSDRDGRRDLVQRFVEVRRIRPVWWLFIAGFFPLVALASNWIGTRLGGPSVGLDRGTILDPAALVVWLVVAFVGGPLAEEFGWRGYALDRLQAFGGAVNSSVALGILWALWHLPLFFIPGTAPGAIGFGSWGFWLWTTQMITQSTVYSWLYYHTNRSIFGAVLFHFVHNATFSALVGFTGALPIEFQVGVTAISIVAFLLIAAIWRGQATRTPAGAS